MPLTITSRIGLFLLLAFSCVVSLAQGPAPVDPKYLLGPLQAQRDKAANDAALCGAEVARLNERIAELEKKIKQDQKE